MFILGVLYNRCMFCPPPKLSLICGPQSNIYFNTKHLPGSPASSDTILNKFLVTLALFLGNPQFFWVALAFFF